MNAKTTAMLLATGVLTGAAYANSPADSAASAPTAITRSTGIENAIDASPVHQPTVSEVILSDYRYGYSDQTGVEPTQAIIPEKHRKADPFSLVPSSRRVIFGVASSPIVLSYPSGPAVYFPSVSFRFDFDRSHRS